MWMSVRIIRPLYPVWNVSLTIWSTSVTVLPIRSGRRGRAIWCEFSLNATPKFQKTCYSQPLRRDVQVFFAISAVFVNHVRVRLTKGRFASAACRGSGLSDRMSAGHDRNPCPTVSRSVFAVLVSLCGTVFICKNTTKKQIINKKIIIFQHKS